MRVLFLTPRQLDEPRSGGTIKSAAVLAHLEERHEVDVAAFARPGAGWERSAGRTVTLPLDRPRSATRLASSYLRSVPLSVERNRHPGMVAAVLDRVEDRDHEAVLVDGWLMAQYLPHPFAGRTLLHQHNAEHVMWRRQAELETSAVRRAIVGREAARVERYERAMLRRFDVVFAVSEPDRDALLRLGAPPPVPLLPNVPGPSLLAREPLRPLPDPVLLHLGTLSWPPNVAGLVRFLRDGFPALRREVPGARLVLAGAGAPAALTALADRTAGVEIVGAVADDEPLYRSARCFVDLGLGGAGTRVKILNALARGLPVVATTDAAEGLDAEPGADLLLAEDPSAAVPLLVGLLTDDRTWRSLSERGRALISSRYRPDVAFASLDAVLDDRR
jgi:glycosyltransferase involved in cell wall biosynthesis